MPPAARARDISIWPCKAPVPMLGGDFNLDEEQHSCDEEVGHVSNEKALTAADVLHL